MYQYLDKIDSPADLKKLQVSELPVVCDELRRFIIDALSKNPGHLASSLGTVELTVALHYVFDTPNDKLVWDVGHQAYGHKILTGRRDRFHTNRQLHGLSPFTNPAESEYDAFIAGHASNSISAALGMDVAVQNENVNVNANENENDGESPETKRKHVVAIIGDGAMTGGLAFEGLNNTGMIKNDLLVILNDNNMAIDPIHGGFTQYLVDITTSPQYNRIRYRISQFLSRLHLIDDHGKKKLVRVNNNLKTILTRQSSNIFTGLNIRYFGPADGHNVVDMVRILSEIKNHRGPKVLHIITQKGKGYAPAEQNQTIWHAPGQFDVETGVRAADKQGNSKHAELWQDVFGHELLRLAKQDKRIIGVTPAMPTGCSMNILQHEMPSRVFDVGIAEGHAVTFSAGMAKEGLLPFCNIYSTFMQRAYDNIVHDVALQNLHVVLCIDRAGIVGNDGATHHGLLDLNYLRSIPNMQICSPRTDDDLREMMRLAAEHDGPTAIRYPRGASEHDEQHVPVEYGRGVQLREGNQLAVITLGPLGNRMQQAIDLLYAEHPEHQGKVAHYDLRWLKPMDEQMLSRIGEQYRTIITLEDGMLAGGAGSAVLEWMSDHGFSPRVIRLGVNDHFVEHGNPDQLYEILKLDKISLCESLSQALEQ